jgi:effector-binding domain-containing protein
MFEPEIKTVESETVAFVEMQGPYAQIPEGYGRLYGWVAQHGMTPEGMPKAVYLTAPDQVPEEQARWELWAPVAEGTAEQPTDDSGCGVKRVGERLVASAMHTGPYETIGETYEPLGQWLFGQGYAIAGPSEEVYFSDPEEVPPEEYVTEVRFPVAKR